MDIEHSLEGSESFKPTLDCRLAENMIFELVADPPEVDVNLVNVGGGECGIQVLVTDHSAVLSLAKKIKGSTDFYTYVRMGKTRSFTKIWYDEKPQFIPPVKDDHGKVIDALPTNEECNIGKNWLQERFPSADFQVKSSGKRALRCYVRGVFPDETAFEDFLKRGNGHSKYGKLFQMHGFERKVGNKTVEPTVWIHALIEL